MRISTMATAPLFGCRTLLHRESTLSGDETSRRSGELAKRTLLQFPSVQVEEQKIIAHCLDLALTKFYSRFHNKTFPGLAALNLLEVGQKEARTLI